MAYANTAKYSEITLAVEFDPVGAAGTYTTVCGITNWSYSENTNLDETEVPDCADLDAPMQIERAVRSVGAQASCSGVWALSSHQAIVDWRRNGTTLNARVTFGKVTASGASTDTETMTGPAYLTNWSLEGTYGQKWTSSFDLVFDGLPVVALKGP